jgi:hypothetical protein
MFDEGRPVMPKRLLLVFSMALGLTGVGSTVALACGGLVAPGHAEVLRKATTLSAWHAGFEHYVTGFQFAGAADRFGYIVPLPGVPTKIEKGGGWTLERLEREVNPVELQGALFAKADAARVSVLQQVKIDALNITVVRGGGADVAAWASRNGFDLTPDTPTVLGRYSSQGSIFALARFDRADAARRGLIEGQGQTIHFTIPMKAPWIPLQILALGKGAPEFVDADLFVLTDDRPTFSPGLRTMPGMHVRASSPASRSLLADLRSDQGMSWVPSSGMWLTALTMHTTAAAIHADLSIDGGGPAGLPVSASESPTRGWTWGLTGLIAAAGIALLWALWRPARPTPRLA